jgi:hypothetical protein
MRRLTTLTACVATSLVLLSAPSAFALGTAKASPTGKGITGGALLGAEAVMLVEAAIDVQPAWAYIVGGVAGAAGGGVGGYFIEKGGEPQPSMFLLAGGLALAIPTTVAVLSATAYKPPPAVQDNGPTDEPVAEPPQQEAPAPPPTQGRLQMPKARERAALQRLALQRPPALLGLKQDGYLTLSVPTIELRDRYTPAERFEFGLPQRTELHVAVLDVTF